MRILIAKLTLLTAMALVLFGIKTGLAISPDGWESAWDGALSSWKEIILGLVIFGLGYFWRGATQEIQWSNS